MKKAGATRRSRTGDLLITNRGKVLSTTGEAQPFPMNWAA